MRALLKLALAAALAASIVVAAAKIEILDYCDPSDPAWAPTGGCVLKEGDVTFAEFNELLSSVLSTAVVGHPAWRFEPSFAETQPNGAVMRSTSADGDIRSPKSRRTAAALFRIRRSTKV